MKSCSKGNRCRCAVFGMALAAGVAMGFSALATAGTAPPARTPVDVVLMSTSFGTHMYDIGAAYERVFRETKSWVRIRHQETPGGMYIFRYMAENRGKMVAGEIPHTIAVGGLAAVRYVAEGRAPFEKCPWPTTRALVSNPAMVLTFGTFNPNIGALTDLAGKRVGTAEGARPFIGMLVNRALFEKGIGNYHRIKWAPVGLMGGKDALLNGTIDATVLGFIGRVSATGNGACRVSAMVPTPPTRMLMNAGRKLRLLSVEKAWVEKGFDFKTAPIMYPARVPGGLLPGYPADMTVLAAFGLLQCDAALPGPIVAEIVRVRHEQQKRFARGHASLAMLPDSPYPVGSPKGYVHPAVFKAMEQLGLPIP